MHDLRRDGLRDHQDDRDGQVRDGVVPPKFRRPVCTRNCKSVGGAGEDEPRRISKLSDKTTNRQQERKDGTKNGEQGKGGGHRGARFSATVFGGLHSKTLKRGQTRGSYTHEHAFSHSPFLTRPVLEPAHHLGGRGVERRALKAGNPQEALRQLVLLGEVQQRPGLAKVGFEPIRFGDFGDFADNVHETGVDKEDRCGRGDGRKVGVGILGHG